MMQDRVQKANALQYITAKRWFPQLELDVYPNINTSAVGKALTDIDLFALIPDEFEGFRALLIDCKTRKSESPISRAIWQRGLMDVLKATRGICILKRDVVERDHRYTAAQFGVMLLTEDDFRDYVRASGVRAGEHLSNIANIDLWDIYFALPQRYPHLASAIHFSKSGYWANRTESEACRRAILQAIKIKSELDPSKREHLTVVGDLVALFMHSVAMMVTQIYAGYLKPERREDLADALLMLLYGGKEAYDVRNQIRRLALSTNANSGDVSNLMMPGWDQFIQLIRHCLDAPVAVLQVPLLMRELAWSFLGQQQIEFAQTLAGENPQAAKLALLGMEYLCRAASFPPEFSEVYADLILRIQPTPP